MDLKQNTILLLNQMKNLGWSRRKIEEKLDYSEKYIDQALSKGSNDRLYSSLKQLYDNIRGLQKTILVENIVSESEVDYISKRRNQKNSSSEYLVPFVDIKAQAGYSQAYSNIDYIGALKQYPILPDVDPTGGTWRYFQVDGDSMEPEIKAGDTLLCSLVLKEDWQYVRDTYTYVVVTDEELLIKDILKLKEDSWVLLSQNEHHPPKKIMIENIKQVWVVRRHIKNRLNKTRRYDLDSIKKHFK